MDERMAGKDIADERAGELVCHYRQTDRAHHHPQTKANPPEKRHPHLRLTGGVSNLRMAKSNG